MNAPAVSFLDSFKAAAARAEAAETQYRQESVRRTAELEKERAFAFRRLNLLTAVASAAQQSEDEEAAIASGLALLRERAGWSSVDDARTEVLARFTSVVQAVFRSASTPDDSPSRTVQNVLTEFENWYLDSRQNAFWALFEQQLPELPLVEV